jgi:hypothetical protein
LLLGKDGRASDWERTVKGQRVGHMVAMPLETLRKFGLYAVVPKASPAEAPEGEKQW